MVKTDKKDVWKFIGDADAENNKNMSRIGENYDVSKMNELKKAFNAGLAPGEYIEVKAPFATPDGNNEWMWVEITVWNGDTIKGLLKNEPYEIPTLHGGQIVEVKQQDIFDYIRRYADGKEEGNQTSAIILKMQASAEKK